MVEKYFEDGTWKVRLSGDVDMYNSDELKAGLSGLEGVDVTLDCSELTYIDSTGLGILVSMLNSPGRRVLVRGLKPHIYKIFKLTALDGIFDIEVAG